MKKKIMVVDDNPSVTLTVKRGLEKIDDIYEVISVGSGEQCLEMLENNQIPDLIILDIMMPGMNGWEVFNRLKQNPIWMNISVVFLTARTDPVAGNAGRFLAEDYIEKPFDIYDLKSRIDKVLES